MRVYELMLKYGICNWKKESETEIQWHLFSLMITQGTNPVNCENRFICKTSANMEETEYPKRNTMI